jgi:hypothetical protein
MAHADNRELARELVLASIERVEHAREEWRRVEAEPSSTSLQRSRAWEYLQGSVKAFGHQWENVKFILEKP